MGAASAQAGSRPRFRKYRGHYQLHLEEAGDLLHLLDLEDGRWMATSCPVFGLKADAVFLHVLDADGNGRILSDDVRQAVRWLFARLRPDPSWTEERESLALELIDVERPEGAQLAQTARRVLAATGAAESGEIALAQVRAFQQSAAQRPFNGDGVLPPESIEDGELAALARAAMAALGGTADASGRMGVDEALFERFLREATAYVAWWERGQEESVRPFGERTDTMFAAVEAVRAKVEQFFARCALVRFDPGMAGRMGLREAEREELADAGPAQIAQRLRQAPLAGPNPEGVLPLGGPLNEFYREAVEVLRRQVVEPLFGESAETLDEARWRQLEGRFKAHAEWRQARPETGVDQFGVERLRDWLGAERAEGLRALMARDRELAAEVQQVRELEKLLLYHRRLFSFANNFVSFPYLFTQKRAIFETGTLVLAGREFSFCVQVENRAAHAGLAKNSGIFLLYVQVSGPLPGDNFEVVTPVTSSTAEGLYAGRRGVFFTLEGRELDAQITQIVDNPVSFWETFKAPLRFLRQAVSKRFEQLSGSVHKEVEGSVARAGTQVESSVQASLREAPQAVREVEPVELSMPEPAAPASRAGNARDVMIGVGFLVAGLGTALKFLTDAARQLSNPRTVWMLLALVVAFLVVLSLFNGLGVYFRLRRRDLGVLLQASGWAINGRLRLTRRMARFFTCSTPLPEAGRKERGPGIVRSRRVRVQRR